MNAPLFEAPATSPPAFGNRRVVFTVYGTPVPQGSMKAFTPKGWHRPVITGDNARTKPWKQQVSGVALSLNVPPFGKESAIVIVLDFYIKKPPSIPKRRIRPIVKPDLDKLCRSCFDSLTGILFTDDAQIVEVRATKHYDDRERVEIQVQEAV